MKFRVSKCILRVITGLKRVEGGKNLRKVKFLALNLQAWKGRETVSEMKNFSNKSCSF